MPIDHPATTTQTDESRIGKIPTLPSWKGLQTERPSESDIRSWFDCGHLRNIGIVTGAISDLVVVDCDSPEAIAWADARLPATPWRSRTGKGEHRGYRHPGAAVKNSVRIDTGDPAVKIDVRGDGGYVVAPGSVHANGTPYEWLVEPPSSRDALPVFNLTWLKADASGANFSGAVMRGAFVGSIRLIRANLDGADMTGADMENATLTDASMVGATFLTTDLYQATLLRANLTDATFDGAFLSEARMSRANLTGASFVDAYLFQVDLSLANLTNADFTAAVLTSANLRDSIQEGTIFTNARMPNNQFAP